MQSTMTSKIGTFYYRIQKHQHIVASPSVHDKTANESLNFQLRTKNYEPILPYSMLNEDMDNRTVTFVPSMTNP